MSSKEPDDPETVLFIPSDDTEAFKNLFYPRLLIPGITPPSFIPPSPRRYIGRPLSWLSRALHRMAYRQ